MAFTFLRIPAIMLLKVESSVGLTDILIWKPLPGACSMGFGEKSAKKPFLKATVLKDTVTGTKVVLRTGIHAENAFARMGI